MTITTNFAGSEDKQIHEIVLPEELLIHKNGQHSLLLTYDEAQGLFQELRELLLY